MGQHMEQEAAVDAPPFTHQLTVALVSVAGPCFCKHPPLQPHHTPAPQAVSVRSAPVFSLGLPRSSFDLHFSGN